MKNKTNICLAVVLILFVIGGIFLYAQSETFTINSTSSNVLKYEAKRNQENPKDSMQTFQKDDSEPPIILVNKAEDKNWAKSHAVTITISDKESNLAEEIELQYAWSESKEEEPVQWNKMTSKSKTIVKSGITGKYYLWIKPVNIKDISGNAVTETIINGEYYFDSEGPTIQFGENGNENWKKEHSVSVVIKEKIDEVDYGIGIDKESIKYVWSKEKPTKEEIIHCIDNEFINIDTANEISVAITNNIETGEDWKLWVYVEDRLGNVSIANSEAFCLDNTAPTIQILEDESCNEWKNEHNVQINICDKQSGLAPLAKLEYGWSVSSTIEPQDWMNINLDEYVEGEKTVLLNIKENRLAGKYYLWIKPLEVKDIVTEEGNVQTNTIVSRYPFAFENIGEGNVEIVFSKNGNTKWSQIDSTIVTVTGKYKPSTLKYQWTVNAKQPEEETFKNVFTSGEEIQVVRETGELYLWILAKDEDGNSTVARSNVFYLDNDGPKLVVTPSNGEGMISNVKINITESEAGLKENNIYEYALINNFTGDLQTSWEYYIQSNKLEWRKYNPFESFTIGEKLKGEFYVIVKGIEDNVGNTNSWNAVPEYTPIGLEENIKAFGPYNFKNIQDLDITMTPNGNKTWDKKQESVLSVNSTYEIKQQKYLWTRESIITSELLKQFATMENNEKVISPVNAETGKDWYLWGYVEDINGNIVLEKSSEFYIDTKIPVVEFIPKGNTKWEKSQIIEVIFDDLGGSGINEENIKYLWQKESSIEPIREQITEILDTKIVDGKIIGTATKNAETGDNWKLWIYLQDIAGNSKIIGSELYGIDNTLPVAGTLTMKLEDINGNDYENNEWTTRNVYIAVNNGSDEHSGHNSTVYSVNNGVETNEPQILTESGIYEITVKTSDNVGNISTNSYVIKITKEAKLEIIANPMQMEYNVYDNFNSEGMVVYVVYDNGDKKETTDYTIVNDENLTCKVEEIQIQYNTNSEIKTIVSGIKVNHKEEIMEKIEATCTEKGKTEGKYCEICNTVLEKQEEIPELGHSFTKYELNNNSTCTKDGTKTAKCDRCEERNTIIDAGTKLEHTYEKEVIIPTCKRAGHTIYKCTKCNENYTDEYTNALGHNFTNYQSNNDSGCEVDGTKTAKCDRCEEIKTVLDEGTKKVHEYKEGRCIYCGKEDVYSEEKENIFNELIINYARLRKQTLARARFSVADITDDGKVTVADLVKINYFRPNEITGT